VWSASSASIRQTWVDGRPVLVDGTVTTVPDEAELRAEARARADRLVRAAGLDAPGTPLTTSLYQ
jgi:5-methylthioadenosine/S-adenosylhomocysteine deaminase